MIRSPEPQVSLSFQAIRARTVSSQGLNRKWVNAVTLNIPFVFSSNGDGFVFHDRTGMSMEREATLLP
jgi:type I restriction enzyme, R subunit